MEEYYDISYFLKNHLKINEKNLNQMGKVTNWTIGFMLNHYDPQVLHKVRAHLGFGKVKPFPLKCTTLQYHRYIVMDLNGITRLLYLFRNRFVFNSSRTNLYDSVICYHLWGPGLRLRLPGSLPDPIPSANVSASKAEGSDPQGPLSPNNLPINLPISLILEKQGAAAWKFSSLLSMKYWWDPSFSPNDLWAPSRKENKRPKFFWSEDSFDIGNVQILNATNKLKMGCPASPSRSGASLAGGSGATYRELDPKEPSLYPALASSHGTPPSGAGGGQWAKQVLGTARFSGFIDGIGCFTCNITDKLGNLKIPCNFDKEFSKENIQVNLNFLFTLDQQNDFFRDELLALFKTSYFLPLTSSLLKKRGKYSPATSVASTATSEVSQVGSQEASQTNYACNPLRFVLVTGLCRSLSSKIFYTREATRKKRDILLLLRYLKKFPLKSKKNVQFIRFQKIWIRLNDHVQRPEGGRSFNRLKRLINVI